VPTIDLEDGRRVGYAVFGDPKGTPAVMLHGFSDSRLGGVVLGEAAARARVRLLVPDRPGTGLSTGRLASLGDCARWLGAFADALGLERFPVLGISGGGPYALACARFAPARVTRALVVCGLGPPEVTRAGMPRGQRLGIAFARRAPAVGAAVMTAVALLARTRPRLFLALVALNASPADARTVRHDASIATVVRPFVEAYRQGAGGVRRDLELVLRPWGFRPEEIAVPVRFEHGTEDATVPLAAAEELSTRVPGATLSVRPGAGHFSLAARHADELLAFLRDGRV
jgi:pimeloyl-ACP methyl ester carboxylesterase